MLLVANGHHWDPRWPEPAFPGSDTFAGTQIHAHDYRDDELFRRVFAPGIANLAFVALLQPVGAMMPIAEAQGKWIAEYLSGDYALPSEAEMRADIAADQAALAKRYVASKRHTIQVDMGDYLYALDKERKAGARRAAERQPA
jgi:hypothetical protein